jgi:hypothetical protein
MWQTYSNIIGILVTDTITVSVSVTNMVTNTITVLVLATDTVGIGIGHRYIRYRYQYWPPIRATVKISTMFVHVPLVSRGHPLAVSPSRSGAVSEPFLVKSVFWVKIPPKRLRNGSHNGAPMASQA